MNNAYKSDLLLVLVTLLASISWMFSKEAVLQMPPLLFMSIRFFLAALLLSCASYRALGKLAVSGVVMVPIIGRALFKEAIPTSTWVALPVALIGLGFLSLSAPMDHALKIETSHILLLSSAALFALYFNLNARVTNIQSFVRDDGEEGNDCSGDYGHNNRASISYS